MKKIAIIGMAILLGCHVATAENGPSAFPFLKIMRDPAKLAAGGAGYASASPSAYGAFSNPSAIPFYGKTADIAAGYQYWQPAGMSTHVFSAAGTWNVHDRFGVTAAFARGQGKAYDIVDENNVSQGSFTPSETQAALGFSWRFLPELALGASLQYAGTSLAEGHSYSAVAADLSVMARFSDVSVAAGLSSLGSAVTSVSGEKFSLPASFILGAAYSFRPGEKHEAELLADMNVFFSGAFSAAAGVRYTYDDLISARVGYHHGAAVIPSFFSLGLGIKCEGVHFDLSYLAGGADSPLNSLSLGIGYCF